MVYSAKIVHGIWEGNCWAWFAGVKQFITKVLAAVVVYLDLLVVNCRCMWYRGTQWIEWVWLLAVSKSRIIASAPSVCWPRLQNVTCHNMANWFIVFMVVNHRNNLTKSRWLMVKILAWTGWLIRNVKNGSSSQKEQTQLNLYRLGRRHFETGKRPSGGRIFSILCNLKMKIMSCRFFEFTLFAF